MYSYTLLVGEDAIRLIRVQGPRHPLFPIRCSMFQTTISNAGDYTAVSYAWEGQTPTRTIKCDGQDLLVTRNCQEALDDLRPESMFQSRVLWIDAICIDQLESSLAERI